MKEAKLSKPKMSVLEQTRKIPSAMCNFLKKISFVIPVYANATILIVSETKESTRRYLATTPVYFI